MVRRADSRPPDDPPPGPTSGPPGEGQPVLHLPRGLAPLGYRDFALYWFGVVVSNTGRWIEMTGLVWIVYDMTESPVLLGLLGLVRAAPTIALSSVAGVVADRAVLRRMLFATQMLALLASLWLGIAILTGYVTLWQIYLQVAVQATIAAFDTAVRQALFPQLVPRLHLSKSVMLNAAAARVAKVLGPAIGGLAIATLGDASPFLINAASFLALMAAVVWMRHTPARSVALETTFWGELKEGLGHVLRVPVISGLLKMEIVFGVFQVNPVLITIVGRELLHAGPERLGVLLAAPAVGSFLGVAWMIVAREPERQGRFSILCTFAYAAVLAALAAVPHFGPSLIVLAALGTLDVFITVTRNAIIQHAAPPGMRGRVMANVGMVTRGVGPLAETQSGVLVGAVGPALAIATAAAALAGGAALTALRNPTLWRLSRADLGLDKPTGKP